MTFLLLFACEGPVGSRIPDAPDADSGSGDTGDGPAAIEHCGAIVVDETWRSAREHRVTCDVTVERGTLTIEAGASVLFDERAGLAVGTKDFEASLVVAGTEAGVVFARSGDQAWEGLVIGTSAQGVVISGLSLRGSGTGVRIDAAAVTVGSLAIDGVDEGCGLTLEGGARLSDESAGVTVTGATGWSVCGEVATAHTLPAAASSYSGNGTDGIYLSGDAITEDVMWENLGVPYVITEVVDIAGTAGAPAGLTIGGGTTLLFERDRGLRFSRTGDASGFVVEGTAAQPVVFDALGADTAGFWRGISASSGAAEVSLHHLSISGAGGDGGSLHVEDVDVLLDEVSIDLSAGAGLWLEGAARIHSDSAGLTVSGSELPVILPAAAVPTLPASGLLLSGNLTDAIKVTGEAAVTESGTWADTGLPYWVAGDVEINGTAMTPAVVTFAPGVALLFGNDSSIFVGKTGAAGLRAAGTAGEPVSMLPWSAFTAGAWGGIGIYDSAVDADVVFTHTEIGYAGGATMRGNVHIIDASPRLSDVRLHNSLEWGLYLGDGSSVLLSNVAYENNAEGDCNECI